MLARYGASDEDIERFLLEKIDEYRQRLNLCWYRQIAVATRQGWTR